MAHDHSTHGISDRSDRKRRMAVVFALTTIYMVAEGLGGLFTGSLALLADAGHMLTDAGALGLALFAMKYSEKPATAEKTYGFHRAEVLAAFANAAILMLISVYILYEAFERFMNPPKVMSTPMLVIAALGLIVNLVGMRLLSGGASHSLNVKAAYLEVLSDMLGSIGVIAAAVIMRVTGWYLADPIFGAAIGLFIIPRTLKMLKDTAHVLMEGTPPEINTEHVQQEILKVPGVLAVHDLHVWTLTSGVHSLTGHVCVAEPARGIGIMSTIREVLEQRFGISHVTIQIEDRDCGVQDLGF